jgi:hypothetical protein
MICPRGRSLAGGARPRRPARRPAARRPAPARARHWAGRRRPAPCSIPYALHYLAVWRPLATSRPPAILFANARGPAPSSPRRAARASRRGTSGACCGARRRMARPSPAVCGAAPPAPPAARDPIHPAKPSPTASSGCARRRPVQPRRARARARRARAPTLPCPPAASARPHTCMPRRPQPVARRAPFPPCVGSLAPKSSRPRESPACLKIIPLASPSRSRPGNLCLKQPLCKQARQHGGPPSAARLAIPAGAAAHLTAARPAPPRRLALNRTLCARGAAQRPRRTPCPPPTAKPPRRPLAAENAQAYRPRR